MNDLHFTLLKASEIFDESKKWDDIPLRQDLLMFSERDTQSVILKKRGLIALITDFSVSLGGFIPNYGNREPRTGTYFTKTPAYYESIIVSRYFPYCDYDLAIERTCGCRPVFMFSDISDLLTISTNEVMAEDGMLEVEYGEYPQTAVPKSLQLELESLLLEKKLEETGKKYTTDSRKISEYNKPFHAKKHIEYEYQGNKYIRVQINSYYMAKKVTLSNGETYPGGEHVWIRVEPVKWLVDSEKKIAIAEKLLFSGVQFNDENNYKGDFEKTRMCWFLNTIFAKDIIPSKIKIKDNLEIPKVYTMK